MKLYYKYVRQRRGVVITLMRAWKGTRVLPMGQWLKAERKLGREGSGRQYWTGWHCFEDEATAKKYLYRFKRPEEIFIIPVMCRNVTKKPGRTEVMLASDMYVPPVEIRNGRPVPREH